MDQTENSGRLGTNSFNKEIFYLLCIVAVGASLRLYRLGSEDIWLDEAISINYHAASTFPRLIKSLARNDSNPPLYFMILHYWIMLGKEPFTVRLLSAIFGTASIPLFYILAKKMFSIRVAGLSTALWTCSPYHIWYSQEARMYSLQILFILCEWYYFISILQENRPGYKNWFFYILFCTAGFYTQYFTLFIILAQGVVILTFWLTKKDEIKILPWIASIFVIAVCCLPLIPLIKEQHFRTNTNWIPALTLQTVLQTPFHFLLGAYTAIPWVGIIISTLCFVILFISILIHNKKCMDWMIRYPLGSIITIGWLGIPILLFSLISFWKPIYVADRYLIISLPAFYLLLSSGMDYFLNSTIRRVVVTLMFITIFISLSSYYMQVKKLPLHIPAGILAQEEKERDILIFLPAWQYVGFEYYLQGNASGYPPAKIPTYFYPTQIFQLWDKNPGHPLRTWYMTVGKEDLEMEKYLNSHYVQKELWWQYNSPLLPKTQITLYQGLVE